MTMNRLGTGRWLFLLLTVALLAAACGGEVTSDADDAGDDTADAGDSGGDATSDDGDDPGDDPDAGDDTTDAGDSGDDGSSDDGTAPNIYDDPRGGIFAEFQAGFDRGDHPFTQLDAFCAAHDPAADRVETEPGIDADEITIVHIRSRLEDAINIGFGIPVGDVNEMFRVYVEMINSQCGGIRGRMINLETIDVALFGPTAQDERNAACLQATEDYDAAMIVNSSGFQGSATLCIVEEKQTIFISTQGQAAEFMERGAGRLYSMGMTGDENLRFSVEAMLDQGLIGPGDVLGVASPDTPGQPESVDAGLVKPLEAAGVEVVFDVIGCGGGTICVEGVPESVARMRDAGITHFFNVMGILTAPGYMDEMVNVGFAPGDVQFFATDFNSQTSELVSGNIANTATSGEFYNGAILFDFRTTGEYRVDGYEPTALQTMCVDTYNENNDIGALHLWEERGGDSAYGMATSICNIVRLAARGIYDAGDNPTRADLETAMANLGPVDIASMSPASTAPGKGQLPDARQTLDFSYPCTQTYPYVRSNGEAVCITGRNDWAMVER